jgi:hypothetical protein
MSVSTMFANIWMIKNLVGCFKPDLQKIHYLTCNAFYIITRSKWIPHRIKFCVESQLTLDSIYYLL